MRTVLCGILFAWSDCPRQVHAGASDRIDSVVVAVVASGEGIRPIPWLWYPK